MSTLKYSLCFLLIVLLWTGCKKAPEKIQIQKLNGPYMGQTLKSDKPEIFASGIVNTGMFTRDMAITPDGKEMYFTICGPKYSFSVIMVSKWMNGKHWAKPEVAWFASNSKYKYTEPCISHDGSKLYFVTNQPSDTTKDASHYDIWVMDRFDTEWAKPRKLDAPVNSEYNEFFPSLTKDGSMYFTREMPNGGNQIMRSRFKNGSFQEPEALPALINCGIDRFNAFIAPDETYLILPVYGMSAQQRDVDYYVFFRNANDQWSKPINMGPRINSPGSDEYSASLSPDGKYLFFMSAKQNPGFIKKGTRFTAKKIMGIHNAAGNGNPCVYWTHASIIDSLKTCLNRP